MGNRQIFDFKCAVCDKGDIVICYATTCGLNEGKCSVCGVRYAVVEEETGQSIEIIDLLSVGGYYFTNLATAKRWSDLQGLEIEVVRSGR